MFKKIVFSLILICLFIAIPLAVMGYKKIELGQPFLAFMQGVSRELDGVRITIPDIPKIQKFELEEASGFLEALAGILNVLINFVNLVITVLNTISMVLNIIIQLLQTIFIVVKHLLGFKDNLAATNTLPVI